MKLGFNSAILDDCTFEEVIDFASGNGFKCVELCAWPKQKATRKYSGVTHIDVDRMDAEYIKSYASRKGIGIHWIRTSKSGTIMLTILKNASKQQKYSVFQLLTLLSGETSQKRLRKICRW